MLRFMPVGDSMTIGSAGEHTWRYRKEAAAQPPSELPRCAREVTE
ncbi:hypothetical protein ABZX69_33025 [Streptomyces sp. NPDC004074]